MTFKELQEEAAARGFSEMFTDPAQLPRLKRWINESYREILDLNRWPFLEATKEGTAPLTIADLGHVLSVTNKTADSTLRYEDRRQVVENDPTLNDTGVAEVWFRAGETQLAVHPLDTASTLTVRYVKTPAKLLADADEPILPESYQGLIVDGTVIRLLRNRNNYEAAQFERQEWQHGIKGMEHALMKPNYDGNERLIVRTGGVGDYLG